MGVLVARAWMQVHLWRDLPHPRPLALSFYVVFDGARCCTGVVWAAAVDDHKF